MAVDFYIKSLLIIALMFIFYNRWTNFVRISDLARNLRGILKELHDDEYSSEFRRDSRGVEVIELRNSMTRIVLTDFQLREELTANLFFKDKEMSGANTAYISRYTAGGGYERPVSWWRHNHLHERVLYNVTGITRNVVIHDLVDEIIRKVREHARQPVKRTPA